MRAESIFLLLDAARMHGDIHQARELNPEHTCLYEGDSERFLSAVAPWLFSIQPGSPFAQWVATNGNRQSWGVLLRCPNEPVRLYKHLRNFLIVQGEDGHEMYFRYYDPRVLRVFLPTCDGGQLRAFFGPIEVFVVEDAEGQVMEYRLDEQGGLDVSATGMDLGRYLALGAGGEPVETGMAVAEKPKKNWDFGY